MKYSDLFTLNGIETVIKINDADNESEAKRLVSTFVVTSSLGKAIREIALPQFDIASGVEGKGIFVVGNFGTGKSHVMSFLSILAENSHCLQYVRDPIYRDLLKTFAGQYKVQRLQIAGTLMPLYEIVAEQLTLLAQKQGFKFEFKSQHQIPDVRAEFRRFMTEFEQHFPGMGVMLVVDELLRYLETRDDQALEIDLAVLQALGEACDRTRFVFIGGLQQTLFNNERFRHKAQSINRIRQRFHDFTIDREGVAQLIEQYLFYKNDEQSQKIRELFQKQFALYENVAPEIEQFVALFPAHPHFIDEFQRVFIVERREILTILTKEARALKDTDIDSDHPELITSDKYWKHIEGDAGLKAYRDIAKVIQNVATIASHIHDSFGQKEDRNGTLRLIHALAVNRLTTPTINDPVGLRPEELKNNLFWRTAVPMQDSAFLSHAAKRLLDLARDAANGQFLAVSKETGQYYIDPTRDVDYDQRVKTAANTVSKHVVQRYLNELFTRAMELDNERPVKEGILWQHAIMWRDKNVERPGWLFFGFPNQRSTAQPPQDFYIFIVPSTRITGVQESWVDNSDENYWFMEDFPRASYEESESASDNEANTFLDQLRTYAAARERALECRGDERAAYERIGNRLRDSLIPAFLDHANDWISVRFQGQKRRLGEWLAELAPSQQQGLFKSKVDTLCQLMFAPLFDQKYPGYPMFSHSVQEHTRAQNAQAALEIVCNAGMTTSAGKSVLVALSLYEGDVPTPEKSRWLTTVVKRLMSMEEGQILNNSDLFEKKDGRNWMKGESIEAEWLHVVIAAGIEAGSLVVYGPGNTKFDAVGLKDFYQKVKSCEHIIRVGRPVGPPIEKWKKLFGHIGASRGLLSTVKTHGDAIKEFQARRAERVEVLVQNEAQIKGQLPFLTEEEDRAAVSAYAAIFKDAIALLDSLQPLNSAAKMANLKMEDAEIANLGSLLSESAQLDVMLKFIDVHRQDLATLERYRDILTHQTDFQTKLKTFVDTLHAYYRKPIQFTEPAAVAQLRAQLTDTIRAAFDTYRAEQKLHSLDSAGDARKKRVLQSSALKQLNKLAQIKVTNRVALDELHSKLDSLPIYKSVTNEDLLQSPTSLCPLTKFDPRLYQGKEPAIRLLEDCERLLEKLHLDWTAQLLKELKDPAIEATLSALTPAEKRIVDEFRNAQELPGTIDDSFILAINTALGGLHKKSIKAVNFARDIVGDGGVPLRVEDLRKRFEQWLKQQIGSDQPETVRFVIED